MVFSFGFVFVGTSHGQFLRGQVEEASEKVKNELGQEKATK